MELFPHVLIRVAGGPIEPLEAMNCERAPQIAETLRDMDRALADLRTRVSEAMHAAVPRQDSDEAGKKLINLRRDVFNGRNVSAAKRAWIKERVEHGALVDEWTAAEAERERLFREGEAVFNEEQVEARRKLQALTQSDNLRKGLVLSSQVLLKAIDRYAAKPANSIKKRYLKTELSLIKYLSRIHGKTSPFSAFTHLAMGSLASIEEDALIRLDGSAQEVGHIRLNNQLFKYLLDLFKAFPLYAERIPVRPNPTVKKEDQCFLYLTNSNNVESFQRIPLNPVLDLFLELAGGKPGGTPSGELAHMALEAIDADLADIKGYIGQLLEYGFLEYNIGISGIDPDWDEKLVAVLGQWDRSQLPHADELIEVLVDLREKATRYAEVDAETRIRLLEEAHERFKGVCMAIHQAAGLPETERMTPQELRAHQEQEQKEREAEGEQDEGDGEESGEEEEVFKHQSFTAFRFNAEQVFYEDVALDGDFVLDAAAIRAMAAKADAFYRELGLFISKDDSHDEMKQYFDQKFSDTVDLLTYYESFYRDFKKPLAEYNKKKQEEAQKKREAQKNGEAEAEGEEAGQEPQEAAAPSDGDEGDRFKVATVDARGERRKQWREKFSELALGDAEPSGERVEVSLDDVRAVNRAVKIDRLDGDVERSFALFIQLFHERDEHGAMRPMGVISANPFGYGRFFSRFLHIFEDSITEEVRAWNRRGEESAMLLEDCDASTFNANLHPPLMPFEVWMPGGQNSLPPERQAPITQINLRLNPETDRLELSHGPSGKPIHVFDLGFQGPRGRSELFRMLGHFNPAFYLSWDAVSGSINDRRRQKGEPSCMPRIVFEDCLVLQRRHWIFPKPSLPERGPQDTDWRYFQKILAWRAEHGLPDEVFVYVTQGRQLELVDEEARRKVGRDDYKPQYISFHNPILVRLLEKLIDKTPEALTVAEMAPNSGQLQRLGDRRYVTECIMQWNSKM